jgi:drug/metabolite transporter (DMT)-like permease
MAFMERKKGIVALVLLALVWGALPLLPRYLSLSFTVFQQVYLRMFTGLIILFLIFRRNLRPEILSRLPAREWFLLACRAALYYVFGVTLFTQALLMTKIINVSAIGVIPMTAILGFIFLKEKITLFKVAAVMLAAAGAMIISVQDWANLTFFGVGELFALISNLFISLALITRKLHSPKLNDREIATVTLLFAGLFVFTLSLATGEGLPLTGWNTGAIVALLLSGLLNAGVSFFANYGFSRVEAAAGNNILVLEPVFAGLFAFLIFRETPVFRELIGGALIIVSVLVIVKLGNRESK